MPGFGLSASCCLFSLSRFWIFESDLLSSFGLFLSAMLLRSCWSRVTSRAALSNWRALTCPSTTCWPGSASTTISLVKDAHVDFSFVLSFSWSSVWFRQVLGFFFFSKCSRSKKKETRTELTRYCRQLSSETKTARGVRFFTQYLWWSEHIHHRAWKLIFDVSGILSGGLRVRFGQLRPHAINSLVYDKQLLLPSGTHCQPTAAIIEITA